MKMDTAETLSYAETKTVEGEAVPQTTISSVAQREKSKGVKRKGVENRAKGKAH